MFENGPKRGFLIAPPEALHSSSFSYFQDVRRLTQSLQFHHNPTEWFRQRLTVGLDITHEEDVSLTRRDDRLAQFFSTRTALGSKSVDRHEVAYTTVDYSGTVDANLSSSLSSATSVGAQFYRRHDEFTSADGNEFPAPGLEVICATATTTGSDDFFENTTVGVYIQEQFGWSNRAFLTGALRIDNNSAFGENFDFIVYPKLSAAWVVSEEPFWNMDWLSTLRLRMAYGQSGQQPRSFAALRTYEPVTAGDGSSAITPQFVGNPDLAPERGTELEGGFEAGLFDQRLSLDFTYYYRKTVDAILERATAPSYGFPGTMFVNAGAIQSKGAELQIRAVAVDAPDVTWDWTVNLSKTANEVLDLGREEFVRVVEDGTGFITPLGSQRHQVGYPLGAWFGEKVISAEVNADGIAENLMCDGGPGSEPVPCADAPEIYLGRSAPNFEGSVSTIATLFGRLQIYALVDFKTGMKTYNNTFGYRCQTRLTCIENVMPLTSDPVAVAVAQSNRAYWNTYLLDSSFAKLRELSVTYTFLDDWARRFGMNCANGGVFACSVRVNWLLRNVNSGPIPSYPVHVCRFRPANVTVALEARQPSE